jgi:hypothetical protein
MSHSQYTLDIISNHPKFNSKSLRKYTVDGIETVGAWGNEPFEIRFKNNTWQRVQVKLSIDGTDIITGDLASTEPSSKMWLVDGGSTISLKAWPETNNGGARFIFTSGEKGVAANTHGDLSNRGIIAAAVYVEGDPKPAFIYTPILISDCYKGAPRSRRINEDNYFYGSTINNNSTLGNSKCFESNTTINSYNSADCRSVDSDSVAAPASASLSEPATELKSLASVGAGEYVNQNIRYVEGLRKPVFTEVVRVRYLWWDELEAKLKDNYRVEEQPSGFPADKKNINLGNTPRIKENQGGFRRSANPEFARV